MGLKTGLAYATISDYFDVPISMVPSAATFVVLPSGTAPATTPTWMLDASMGPDRALMQLTGLHAGQRATLVVRLDTSTNQIEWEELDESLLPANDPTQATLHVASRLIDLGGGVVLAYSVVGQPCLITDSLATPDTWHVPAGAFDFGVYDRQTVSDCSMMLASTHLDVAAGADRLVVIYHEGNAIKFLDAPIQ